MHYIILDSNIWLNALKVYDEENQIIDALEYWIEQGHITVLLPDIIITEWKRNREKKKKELLDDWKDFLRRARKFFDPQLVNELINPDQLEKRVEEQLARVEKIFREHATVIPVTDECRIEATKRAELKLAPWVKRNSIGDDLIYISMTWYVISAMYCARCWRKIQRRSYPLTMYLKG